MRLAGIAVAAAAVAWGVPTAAVAQKAQVSIETSEPCGSAQNKYLCGRVQSNSDLYLNAGQFKFKGKGKVNVTWQGTVFCQVTDTDAGSAANSKLEYYLHLNLGEGQMLGTVNEPGSTSVGESLNVRATTSDVGVGRTMLSHVTLSNTFQVAEAGRRVYRVWAKGDFRSVGANSFCNVNGGVFTAIYTPKS